MDSSLRIIICLLKIPTTNATRVSSKQNVSVSSFCPLITNLFLRFFHHTESPGALFQAAELRHPVWNIRSLLPCGALWTLLQSLQ